MSQNSRYAIHKIDWVNTLFLILSPIVTVGLILAHIEFEGWNPWHILVGMIFYFATGLSITAGYHRLFSHRTYEANSLVKLFFLIFGAAAFQNSLLKWATDHRRHHLRVDTDEDPYSINKGFFYAHMGWIFLKEEEQYKDKFPKDLTNDSLVMWQHKYYLPIAIISGLLLPAIIGLMMGSPIGGLAIAGFARLVLVHHFTFFINSLCHVLGKRPYTDENTARDSYLMAFFTYGEGYHNFHHKFQTDYRNGLRWYQFDPSKWLINVLAFFGMAGKLKRTSEADILIAKMAMDRKNLYQSLSQKQWIDLSRLDQMKAKVEEAQRRFQELKAEYKELKRTLPKDSREKLLVFKSNMKMAKIEFQMSYAQWRAMTKTMYGIA